MKKIFLDNLVTFAIFSIFAITLLGIDNRKIDMMVIKNDASYCSQIYRDFLKVKCIENYTQYVTQLCQRIDHERFRSECIEEKLRDVPKVTIGAGNMLMVIFELALLWFLARVATGDFYGDYLVKYIKKPFIGKVILFYRIHQEDSPSFLVCALMACFLFGLYVASSNFLWNI